MAWCARDGPRCSSAHAAAAECSAGAPRRTGVTGRDQGSPAMVLAARPWAGAGPPECLRRDANRSPRGGERARRAGSTGAAASRLPGSAGFGASNSGHERRRGWKRSEVWRPIRARAIRPARAASARPQAPWTTSDIQLQGIAVPPPEVAVRQPRRPPVPAPPKPMVTPRLARPRVWPPGADRETGHLTRTCDALVGRCGRCEG